jgi:hypothetical protein
VTVADPEARPGRNAIAGGGPPGCGGEAARPAGRRKLRVSRPSAAVLSGGPWRPRATFGWVSPAGPALACGVDSDRDPGPGALRPGTRVRPGSLFAGPEGA